METQKGEHVSKGSSYTNPVAAPLYRWHEPKKSAPLLVATPLLETLPRVELEATCRGSEGRFNLPAGKGVRWVDLQKFKTGTMPATMPTNVKHESGK